MHELGKASLLVEINNLVKSLASWLTQNYYLPFAFWKRDGDQSQCVFKQTQLLSVFCLGLPALPYRSSSALCTLPGSFLFGRMRLAAELQRQVRSEQPGASHGSYWVSKSEHNCWEPNLFYPKNLLELSASWNLLPRLRFSFPFCHSKRWWKPSWSLTALVWPYDLVLEVSKLLAWGLVA